MMINAISNVQYQEFVAKMMKIAYLRHMLIRIISMHPMKNPEIILKFMEMDVEREYGISTIHLIVICLTVILP